MPLTLSGLLKPILNPLLWTSFISKFAGAVDTEIHGYKFAKFLKELVFTPIHFTLILLT